MSCCAARGSGLRTMYAPVVQQCVWGAFPQQQATVAEKCKPWRPRDPRRGHARQDAATRRLPQSKLPVTSKLPRQLFGFLFRVRAHAYRNRDTGCCPIVVLSVVKCQSTTDGWVWLWITQSCATATWPATVGKQSTVCNSRGTADIVFTGPKAFNIRVYTISAVVAVD